MLIKKKNITLFSFIKLKYLIQKNVFYKSEKWMKILGVVIFLFIFLNYMQSGIFLVDYFTVNFSKSNELFKSIFTLTFFAVFIINLFSTAFFSGSYYTYALQRTILFYPLKLYNIVKYETIGGIFDIVSLVFYPLYFSAIFLSGFLSNWLSYFEIILLLILFLVSVSALVYAVRNTLALLNYFRYSKIIGLLFFLFLTFCFVLIIKQIPFIFDNKDSLARVLDYIEYSPTSIFTSILFNSGSTLTYNFIKAVLYFIILNTVLFSINYFLMKLLKRKMLGKAFRKFSTKQRILTKLFEILKTNPFSKKDIIYSLRSLRVLFSHISILILVILILIETSSSAFKGDFDIIQHFTISTFLIALIVLNFNGNIFAFEEAAIVNYFSKPITYEKIILGKTYIANFYLILFSFANIYILLFNHTELLDIFFFHIMILIFYFLLLVMAFPLSFYFPKKISFHALNGFLTSLTSVFIFLIIFFVGLFFSISLFQFYLKSEIKPLLLLLAIIIIVFIVYMRRRILLINTLLLTKRKEEIIKVIM